MGIKNDLVIDEEINYKMDLGNKLEDFVANEFTLKTGKKVRNVNGIGNKLEDFVANEFTLKTGKKVRNVNGILKNDKYPFALANIDRAVVGEKAFLECKVTNSYSKKSWQKEVPIYCQVQCYHYMAVTGATHCYIAALIGNEELVIHKLDRNEELINEIMNLEKMFWDKCILGEELPIPDGSDDYSSVLQLVIHKLDRNEELINEIMNLEKMFWDKCILGEELPIPDGSDDYSSVLQGLYKDSIEEEVILFEKEDLLKRYDDVRELVKDLDSEKKAIEQYLQMQMKEYEVAYLGDRKITWKKQVRNTVDTKRLKKEHPEIVEKYMKTTLGKSKLEIL